MRKSIFWLILLSSLNSLITKSFPVVFLDAEEYGWFSIPYMVFILGSALGLALVSESENRSLRIGQSPSTWETYKSVSLTLSIGIGAVGFFISLSMEQLRSSALLILIALTLTSYKGVLRFRLTQERDLKRVVTSDLVGLLAYLGVFFWLASSIGLSWRVEHALVAWTVAAVAEFSILPQTQKVNPLILAKWIRDRWCYARPLLLDSTLQEVGTVWTPSILALLLNVASLGIYRAVSTVAAPIRMIITPLRPLIASASVERIVSKANLLLISSLACIFGVASFVVLEAIEANDIQVGVISDLVRHSLAIAIFVAGNVVGQVYSSSARALLAERKLLSGRITQAILLGALPIVGAWVFGLVGAIWTLALGNIASGYLWFILLHQQNLK